MFWASLWLGGGEGTLPVSSRTEKAGQSALWTNEGAGILPVVDARVKLGDQVRPPGVPVARRLYRR